MRDCLPLLALPHPRPITMWACGGVAKHTDPSLCATHQRRPVLARLRVIGEQLARIGVGEIAVHCTLHVLVRSGGGGGVCVWVGVGVSHRCARFAVPTLRGCGQTHSPKKSTYCAAPQHSNCPSTAVCTNGGLPWSYGPNCLSLGSPCWKAYSTVRMKRPVRTWCVCFGVLQAGNVTYGGAGADTQVNPLPAGRVWMNGG